MFVEIQVSYSLCKQKEAIQGVGKLGQNDITWGEANSTGVPPDKKEKKAEKLTYLFYKHASNKMRDISKRNKKCYLYMSTVCQEFFPSQNW